MIASKQSYWLDICFEFLVRKKAIKFWQILKNANVGPNVDISVTADRRLCGGQNQEGNFNIHVRKNWKMAYWNWNCFYFISCLQQWWGVAILAYLIKAMLLGELCSSMYWTGIICLHNFWNISIGWPHFYRLKKNIGL